MGGPQKVTGLTPVRMEILRAFQSGLKVEEVGAQVFLTPRTVSRHVSRLCEEFGAKNLMHLIVKLMRKGELQ